MVPANGGSVGLLQAPISSILDTLTWERDAVYIKCTEIVPEIGLNHFDFHVEIVPFLLQMFAKVRKWHSLKYEVRMCIKFRLKWY